MKAHSSQCIYNSKEGKGGRMGGREGGREDRGKGEGWGKDGGRKGEGKGEGLGEGRGEGWGKEGGKEGGKDGGRKGGRKGGRRGEGEAFLLQPAAELTDPYFPLAEHQGGTNKPRLIAFGDEPLGWVLFLYHFYLELHNGELNSWAWPFIFIWECCQKKKEKEKKHWFADRICRRTRIPFCYRFCLAISPASLVPCLLNWQKALIWEWLQASWRTESEFKTGFKIWRRDLKWKMKLSREKQHNTLKTRIPGCLKLTVSTWGSKVGATPKAEDKEAFSIHWVLLRQFELLEEFQHTNVSRAALNQQCSSTRHHGALQA